MDVRRRRRNSNRLEGYDYSQAGCYFVTVCAQDRANRFGEIVNEQMCLNDMGRIVGESWEWLERRYDNVGLDVWVIMPNHFHNILIIRDTRRGDSRTAPTIPLGRLIGAFKTVSTKRINRRKGTPGTKLWQRSFYDHVIRDDEDLNNIREYIQNNPLKWALDEYNPSNQMGS